MRAFIAIELPKEIRDALGILQQKLRSSGAEVKWVAPENIHLTLKFLGEIDDTQLPKFSEIIEETSRNHNSFQIRINSIGVFPKLNSPRVIWVGVDKGDGECKKIAAELEEKIAAYGIPEEKREFSSHITIARVKSLLNRDKLVQELNQLAGYFRQKNLLFYAVKITLFKSTLTPKGPIYEVQREASLRAS